MVGGSVSKSVGNVICQLSPPIAFLSLNVSWWVPRSGFLSILSYFWRPLRHVQGYAVIYLYQVKVYDEVYDSADCCCYQALNVYWRRAWFFSHKARCFYLLVTGLRLSLLFRHRWLQSLFSRICICDDSNIFENSVRERYPIEERLRLLLI